MGKCPNIFSLACESFAIWHSSMDPCLGTLLQFLFHSTNRIIFQIHWATHIIQLVTKCWCFHVPMVWSLDSLGWCAGPFVLCWPSPPLQLHLLLLLNSSCSHYLPYPQMPSLFLPLPFCSGPSLCRECFSLPSLPNKNIKWFLPYGTSLFPSPHIHGRSNLFFIARAPRSTSHSLSGK